MLQPPLSNKLYQELEGLGETERNQRLAAERKKFARSRSGEFFELVLYDIASAALNDLLRAPNDSVRAQATGRLSVAFDLYTALQAARTESDTPQEPTTP